MKENALIQPKPVAPSSPEPSLDVSRNAQKLARAGLEKQWLNRTRIIMLVLILTGAGLLIPAALDYHYFWPAAVRYLISACWWLLVILACAAAVIEWRRLPGRESVALDLERRLSNPRCEVSTAAQYLDVAAQEPKGIADEIIHALQRRAAIHLQKADSPYRALQWAWGGLLLIGIIATALALALFPSCRMATQRILFPWTLPHYTTVEVRPGDFEIATKTDFDVTARFGGRLPVGAEIEWEDAGGAWKTDQLTQTAPDSFSCKFKDVRGDFTYRVRGNDGLTADYHLRVYTPPEIAAMDVEIIPPAYAQIASSHTTDGNITALRGSELRWRVSSTLPLAKAEFRFKEGAPNLSLNAEDPQTWLGSIILKKNEAYHAALLDLKGRSNRPDDGFHLVALPDAPPEVEILSPEQNITAGPQDKITISIQANDDIGLAEVRMASQKPGSPPQSVVLASGDKVGRHVKTDTTLDLAPLNLHPYDVVMYYAEARDNNTYDGPGVTRSSVHFITIANPAQAPDTANGGGGGSGQEINLMQLQRDLISTTARLPDSASRETKADVASSQHEIKGYAEMVLSVLQSRGVPPQAVSAMSAAVENMNQAEKDLSAGDSVLALDPEGQALANLYQVARLLPNLMSMPEEGQEALTIKLEDLRKAKQQQAQKEISEALAQAQALLKAQQALQQGKTGQGKSPADDPGNDPGKGQGKSPGEDQGQGQDPGKGQGEGQGGQTDSADAPAQGNSELARQQQALADLARELARRLSQSAGDNPGLSHHLGAEAGIAADQMSLAAVGLRDGNPPGSEEVTNAQMQSVEAMTRVIESLARLSEKAPAKVNVDDEGAPPEYSEQLSRYYEKLSHEK
ncbi:MAG TPA: DUF4175 family protein [Candidatus Methylacidiphilales bacterium]|jgi:hypothetical protein|nr:DUF4175 family protein [Candidatus Methylacidiphilales bacterium]